MFMFCLFFAGAALNAFETVSIVYISEISSTVLLFN